MKIRSRSQICKMSSLCWFWPWSEYKNAHTFKSVSRCGARSRKADTHQQYNQVSSSASRCRHHYHRRLRSHCAAQQVVTLKVTFRLQQVQDCYLGGRKKGQRLRGAIFINTSPDKDPSGSTESRGGDGRGQLLASMRSHWLCIPLPVYDPI